MADAKSQDPYIKSLFSRFPDYNSFKVSDFKRLMDGDLRVLLGSIANKYRHEELVPESFIEQYGENAMEKMALGLQSEANRRGKPETYAVGMLNSGLSYSAIALNSANNLGSVNSDVAASATLIDGSARESTAPNILNYQVFQEARALMARNEAARQQGTYTPQTSFDVVVPQPAIKAAVAANKNLPASLAEKRFAFAAEDELACISALATRAGASQKIQPITLEYENSTACAVPGVISQIFNPNKPDIDAGLAWAACYIQGDLDLMTPVARNNVLSSCAKSTSR